MIRYGFFDAAGTDAEAWVQRRGENQDRDIRRFSASPSAALHPRLGVGPRCVKRSLSVAASLSIAITILLFSPSIQAHDPITTKVTFNKEVIRILSRRCQGCHRTGGYAPMAFETYDDVRPWAKAIKEEILERRMPPWNAAQGFADFANDRSLTALETELLVDWVEGGVPIGDVKDLPKAKAGGNTLEKPGLVVEGESSPPVKTQRWISGWWFRPPSGAVQSAEFWIEDAAKKRIYLGNWVPPEQQVEWPDGTAQALPAGSRVLIKMHYTENNGEAPNPTPAGAPELALYFADKPPMHAVRHMDLSCGANTVPNGLEALALYPENSMEVEALLPNGSMDVLGLFRPDFPSYHPTYFYRQPVAIPAGTHINAHSATSDAGCKAVLAYAARSVR
jgi:mono/diheme cytochrome c family protein